MSLTYLIYGHAITGGIALLAGLVAIVAKKGSSIHKSLGKVFFYSMLVSATVAIVIAGMPGHENPFLFSIGLFSLYFLISGYFSLRLKKEGYPFTIFITLAWALLAVGIGLIAFPLIKYRSVQIVPLVFGIFGIVFAIRELRLYKHPEKVYRSWMSLHLGKMTGGYIAAVTAFVVVNNILPGIVGWILPGLIGGVYITWWMRKLK